MIRISLLVASAAVATAFLSLPAGAACREDFLTVQDYSFRDAGDEKVEISFTVQSLAAKPIRMIDATFGLKDALGGSIGSMRMQRDVKIAAGGAYSETGMQGIKEFERLLKIDRADVAPFACVRGVIYEDGSKEQF